MAAVGVEKGRSDIEVSLFPMKILFVQSTKFNSPMIVTDTIMHCIVCALKQLHIKNNYYTKLKIVAANIIPTLSFFNDSIPTTLS